MKDKETLQWMRKNCITVSLAVINVLVFVVLEILGDTQNSQFMLEHGAQYPTRILENREYWRFLTAAFLHFGFLHLLNNMVILLCVSPIMEKALGHVKFLLLYLLAAVGGGAVSFLEMYLSGDYAVSAGASGAVFGVFGGLLWVVIRNKGKYAGLNIKGMLFMIALCLYYGISTAGVDNWGHIGGLVTGFAASIILYCF
jgi:rhomboid protease GluP